MTTNNIDSNLKRKFRNTLVLLLAFFFLLGLSANAGESILSSDKQLTEEIDTLSNQQVAKELEFLRLGLELKRRVEGKRIGRERRFTCYALANSTLTSIGAFMAGVGRLDYASNPQDAPDRLFENATIVRVTANSVSAGGVVVEVAKDSYDALIDRTKKLNLRAVSNEADRLQQEVSQLVVKRATLLTQVSDHDIRRLLQLEQTVLDDVHEAVVDELAAFYAETQGRKASRIIQLTSTGISNTVSGLGSIYSGIVVPREYRDDPVKRVRYGGVGGITDVSTGSLNAVTPLLTFGANIARRRSTKAVLYRQLGARDIKNLLELKAHEDNLKSNFSAASGGMQNGFYARREAVAEILNILERHKAISDKERKNIARTLFINVLDSGVDASGSFSKIVNGIGTLVGSYRYTFDDRKRFRVTGGAGLAYGIGNAIGVEEVLRDIVTRELRYSKQKKKHLLLTQIMDDEISAVNNARKKLAEF